MYEQVFQFNSRPFTSTPFVKHFFPADSIQQALAQARVCIDRASGPAIVIGGTGMGKSLLLAMLEEQYRAQFNVVNLGCARLDRRQDLLQSVLFELKQPISGMTETELRFAVIDYLKPSERCPNGVLLLIDEAHTLPVEILDEIRLITNFVRDGQPRVRLVMTGSQKLEENLTAPNLESFNQRIALRCYLHAMSRDETARYVIEHVDRVGGSGFETFDSASLKAIHEISDGCPRIVNQVCDHALIFAATAGVHVVTEEIVRNAWSDLQKIPGNWSPTSAATSQALQDDESWTVIEFGQLEDEAQSIDETTDATSVVNELESAADEKNHIGLLNQEQVALLDLVEIETGNTGAAKESHTGQLTENLAAAEGFFENELIDNRLAQDNKVAEPESGADLPAETSQFKQPENPEPLAEQTPIEEAPIEEAPIEEAPIQEAPTQEADFEETACEQEDLSRAASLDQPVETDERIIGYETAYQSESETVDQLESALEHETTVEIIADQDQACGSVEDHCEANSDEGLESSHQSAEQAVGELESEANKEPATDVQDQSIPSDVVTQQPVANLRVPQETVDPFSEQFAEEEHLYDRYAPFVAHQNQSSLEVTAQDLEQLNSGNEYFDQEDVVAFAQGQAQTDAQPNAEIAADAETTDTVGDADELDSQFYDDPAETTADAPTYEFTQRNQALENDTPADATEEITVAEENSAETAAVATAPPVADGAADWDEGFDPKAVESDEVESDAVESDNVESDNVALENSDDCEAHRPETETVEQARLPEEDAAHSQRVSQGVSTDGDSAGPPAEKQQKFHEHLTQATSLEIERQAEEILQRLNISRKSVSHETADSDSVNSDSEPLVTADSNVAPSSAVTIADGEYDQQLATIDETQQILNDILEQKNLLASRQQSSDVTRITASSSSTDAAQDTTNSVPIEFASNTESESRATTDSVDDQEMIIVSPSEQHTDAKHPRDKAIQFPSTPVSTGRAERMDYQKLFDQLRDVSQSSETT